MKRSTLEQLLRDRVAKRPVVLITHLASGEERLFHTDAASTALAPEVETACREAVRSDRSVRLDCAEGPLFLHVFNPALRMIIVGAVHIAQPLAQMAALSGYDVTVVDPRRSFATEGRFPSLRLSHEWPDEAIESLRPDSRTAIVTLTHDPKLDDPALRVALRSPAAYVGALGSTRTHAKRLERLRAEGLNEAELARIHGPVGLGIGAKSPPEVAIAIMAQVIQELRREPAAA